MREEDAAYGELHRATGAPDQLQSAAPLQALSEVESLTDLIDRMDRIAFLKALSHRPARQELSDLPERGEG